MLDRLNDQKFWCEVQTITPEVAGIILEHNVVNRDVGKGLVKKMAQDMVSGKWKTNGDSIRFDRNGRLVDGQHRLNAVVQSETPLETFVCGGLDPAVFDTLDVGKKRTLRDVLKIEGIANYSAVAGAIPWLLRLQADDPLRNRSRLSRPADELEYYYGIETEMQSAVQSVQKCKLTEFGNKSHAKSASFRFLPQAPLPMCVALRVLFNRIDLDEAERFFNLWTSASERPDLATSSTCSMLAEALITRNNHMMKVGGRFHDADRLLMVVTAWNAFIRKEKLYHKDFERCNVRHPTRPSKWPGILGPKIEQPQLETE